jgi:hypothetical protein
MKIEDDEGTEWERHKKETRASSPKIAWADKDTRALTTQTTIVPPHPHDKSDRFLQRRLACLVFSLHRTWRESTHTTPTNKCWGGKTKEFRSVQSCLCNHATWYLLGCCRLLLYGFTAVLDESELSLLLQPKVANPLCCFYFFPSCQRNRRTRRRCCLTEWRPPWKFNADRTVLPILRLPAPDTLKRYSKALEYEYRVKTAALGTLKRYSILSLTL